MAAFSDSVSPIVPWTTKAGMTAEVVSTVRSYTPSGGGTAMDAALTFCTSKLAGISSSNARVIVLVTDGVPNDRSTTLSAAKTAKDAGVKLVTVGVGNADSSFLGELASTSDHTFSAPFDYVAVGLASDIATVLCGATATTTARKMLDSGGASLCRGYADGELRLVDESGAVTTASGSGILQIYNNGGWAPICDGFDTEDDYPGRFTNILQPGLFRGQVNTVCRQLGLDPRGFKIPTKPASPGIWPVIKAWDVSSFNCAGRNMCQRRLNVHPFTCILGKDEWMTYGNYGRLADCSGARWKEVKNCIPPNQAVLHAKSCK